MIRTAICCVSIFLVISCQSNNDVTVFFDDFDSLPRGPMAPSTGAHTEYHYLHEAAPKGAWALSTFRFANQNSWRIQDDNGDRVMMQRYVYEDSLHYHPVVATGNEFWRDYVLEVRFAPAMKNPQSGIMFRSRNDRNYYFFGVKQDKAILKMVNDAKAFRKPYEKVLAQAEYNWEPGKYLTAIIILEGENIKAKFENGPLLSANDTTFASGKIGLLADVPTKFSYVKVSMSRKAAAEFEARKSSKDLAEKELQERNPKMRVWKKINTRGFGVGRNLRFGYLNDDDTLDVLIGQVVHHGPSDGNSELSCLTAMTFSGKKLWQIGQPDLWKNHLTNDVGFQIHDIDNDGKAEVIYCMNREIIVADGATGKTKYKTKTPLKPGSRERILGDCLYFCDFGGRGFAGDIVIKDRYHHMWALNPRLEVMWDHECNTGHYPFAYDVDHDGKEELMIGYNLFDDNGELMWTLQDELEDHADGVAIADFKNDGQLRLLCAASDEGMFFANMDGKIVKHHFIGHVQNPVIGNFRDDLDGLEAISINFWGNQGIVHFYDADGNIYYDFEPNQYGSMLLPLNWTGRSEEFFVHNANVDEGGVFDGWGRKVLQFPDDGHPDMCNAVIDIVGDARDEIVVWDPEELWVYTQDDNPRQGKLYKPERNPLYNYSNYQATVSLPGWSE